MNKTYEYGREKADTKSKKPCTKASLNAILIIKLNE